MSSNNYYIKTNRTFNKIRDYGWIFTVMVAIGGLWEPKLGILVVFIMAGLTLTSFFNGRYWCGNFCPHGSLFDKIIMPFSLNKKIPSIFKTKIFVALFFIFFMFNFGRKFIKVMGLWGTFSFWDRLGMVFAMTYLVVLFIGGGFALIVNPRTWCQFCPMGTIQKISYTFGKALGVAKKTEKKVTISHKSLCHSCGKCSRVCPFQLQPYLEFDEHNQFNNINCIKCGTCVENCPAGILSINKKYEDIKVCQNELIGYEKRQKIVAQIKDIIDLDTDIKEYTFKFILPNNISYKSGQFILVKIQEKPKSYRAYSISSYNEDDTTIKVIIKKVSNGYGTAKIFEEFKIGDYVELEGPMGNELVLDTKAQKNLFVANGIGITPFIALVKDAILNNEELHSLKLLSGQRYENQLLYNDYFKEYDKEVDNFEYIPIVSRDKNSEMRKGHVTDVLKEMDLEGYKVYMCGSKKMIVDSYNILIEKGLDSSDIYYESEEKIDLEECQVS